MREMSEITGLPLREGGLGRKQRHVVIHSLPGAAMAASCSCPSLPPYHLCP